MARLFFVEHDGALLGGVARGGFHHAFEDQHIGCAARIGDHGKLGAEVHDIDGGIGDAKAHRLGGDAGREGAFAQGGIPGGIDVQGSRPFEDEESARIEGNFGQAPERVQAAGLGAKNGPGCTAALVSTHGILLSR